MLKICEEDRFPAESTVRGWALDNVGGFSANYTRARGLGLDVHADRILHIGENVDKEDVPRARLDFDAKRWYLSKLAPKVYGDSQLVKMADADGKKLQWGGVTEVRGTDE